jgi:hypothetical protein
MVLLDILRHHFNALRIRKKGTECPNISLEMVVVHSEARMEQLHDNFVSSLAAIQERYRHEPGRKLEHLLLMALEREEIVSIAYREAGLQVCVEQLPIADAMKEIIRCALIWI